MIEAAQRYVVRLSDRRVQIIRDLGVGMDKGLARVIDQWYLNRGGVIDASECRSNYQGLTSEAAAQRVANYRAGAIKRAQTMQERNSRYKHGLVGGVLRDYDKYPTKQEK